MFTRSPVFIRIQNYGERFAGGALGNAWWLMMAPGMGFILVALAILLWPELLAYMVASVFFLVGMALIGWGWRLRSAERHVQRHFYMRTARGW